VNARRVASVAAEMSKRYVTQFAHLAAMARTVQAHIATDSPDTNKERAILTQALAECADQFSQYANVNELTFSLVATDNMHLVDMDVCAAILGTRDS